MGQEVDSKWLVPDLNLPKRAEIYITLRYSL